jgi:hypothetical protein
LPDNLGSKFTVVDTGEGKKVCTGVAWCGAECGCTTDAEFGADKDCEEGWWELEPDDVTLGAEVTGAGSGSFVAAGAPFTGTGD